MGKVNVIKIKKTSDKGAHRQPLFADKERRKYNDLVCILDGY